MPGLYFEEFSVGQTFRHGITRTITEADNVWFSALTHNPAPLHLDEEYMNSSGRQTENGSSFEWEELVRAATYTVSGLAPIRSRRPWL